MPTESKIEPTLIEKLDVVVGVLGVLIRTLFSALKYPFSSASRLQPTLGREITRLLILRLVSRLSITQVQWALPSTTTVYRTWIKAKAEKESAPPEVFTEIIGEDGAKLHWVGRKSAAKVILHFHGGGYAMTLSPGHLNFISYLRREVQRRSGVEVKTAFLEYTLAPVHTYPMQFRQAAQALQHIINSGISPADIVISGDSAGGQLALQILSHILHPHPEIPRIQLTAPFAGILPISPWVIFESSAPSFVNTDGDIVSKGPLTGWSQMFINGTAIADGKAEPDGFWAEPLKAPPEWWHYAEKVTRKMLVVYREYEAFLDDNKALVTKMRDGTAGTKLEIKDVEEPKGIHIGPFIDAFAGRSPGEVSKIMAGWCSECFSSNISGV